jgi:hypothetical protein
MITTHGQNGRERMGIRMHGVRLNLRCDHERLLRYTSEILGPFVCAPCESADLEVVCTWREGAPDLDAQAPMFDVSGLDVYGKRIHLGADVLVWSDTSRHKGLQLRFRRLGSVLHCDVGYVYMPSARKLARNADYERQKFFDLLRHTVFFPIAWHLRRTRGWEMIHASAVSCDSGAVLIAGPGGAGKSTTCLALAALAGMRFLAENLVFSDGQLVYPVFEPIRLTSESLALIGNATEQLERLEPVGERGHKAMFVLPMDPDSPGVRPALLFLARFSRAGFVRPLAPAMARELIRATNTLTLELNDFQSYASALDLMWPPLEVAHEEPLERLTATTPCYSLAIDRSAGVESVVHHVLDCLEARARRVPEARQP